MSIAFTDLCFGYTRSRLVLSDLSGSVASGSVTALVGPNGAGKSTLLRLMAGLVAPTSGLVTLKRASGASPDFAVDVAQIAPADRARHIAYVAQRSSVAFAFPARDVVAMGLHAIGPDEHAVSQAIDALDLGPIASRPFNTLSAGQQQRASIARAVAQLLGREGKAPRSPRFLLADEPLASLDPRHVVLALQLFRQLASQGIGIVLVLHDLTVARRIADHAILLDCGGTLSRSGDAPAVLTPEVLGPAYGVHFESVRVDDGPPALIPTGILEVRETPSRLAPSAPQTR
ncbi:MAG: ABC transporter ATP-binding protein [Phycisphaeraceae bacterium]|nr:ABC transporter ATP-binding protein [Phycisphaeraceae bacterium]